MDKSVKIMDKLNKYLEKTSRRFSVLPAVSSIGFIPGKDNRIHRTFDSVNFSFILSGIGDYVLRGVRYPVKAPCIIAQWPGEAMDYGPAESWDEMYFIYGGEQYDPFVTSHLLLPEDGHPVRVLNDAAVMMKKIERLEAELRNSELDADRIDLLCYELILDSWNRPQATAKEDVRLAGIRQRVEASLGGDIDCSALAEECGMSLASLRRFWAAHHPDETFMEYRNAYFLRRSYELLVGSSLSIKEIAMKIGFADQYYFSRKFHQLSGMTPQEYRHRYKLG